MTVRNKYSRLVGSIFESASGRLKSGHGEGIFLGSTGLLPNSRFQVLAWWAQIFRKSDKARNQDFKTVSGIPQNEAMACLSFFRRS